MTITLTFNKEVYPVCKQNPIFRYFLPNILCRYFDVAKHAPKFSIKIIRFCFYFPHSRQFRITSITFSFANLYLRVFIRATWKTSIARMNLSRKTNPCHFSEYITRKPTSFGINIVRTYYCFKSVYLFVFKGLYLHRFHENLHKSDRLRWCWKNPTRN